MAKKNEIIVKDVVIKTMTKDGLDYICITDIARQKNNIDPNGVIANWMRNRNTIEFLGIWETLHNPNFNPLEFEGFRKEAGLNAFTLSPTRGNHPSPGKYHLCRRGRRVECSHVLNDCPAMAGGVNCVFFVHDLFAFSIPLHYLCNRKP